jgi:signal peptidase I
MESQGEVMTKLKAWLRENRGLLLFLLCFGVVRTAVADYNPIPSGSMRPTLLEGDVVLVDRLAFDAKVPLTDFSLARLGDPRRGDVVTFSSPRDGTRLIKRIVGIPGDELAMRGGVLVVNGETATYAGGMSVDEPIGRGIELRAFRATERVAGGARTVQYLPSVAATRDFGPVRLAADEYFMLGDNRDNSEDSRFIGPVPRHLLIGRAHHVLLSADITGYWKPRLERTAATIH